MEELIFLYKLLWMSILENLIPKYMIIFVILIIIKIIIDKNSTRGEIL